MTLVLDAAPLVALADANEPQLKAFPRIRGEEESRYETRRLLTFDESHFRRVTPLQGGAFELLPANS